MLINLRKCGLSLEDYARITGLDPCLFVGLPVVGGCEPFSCEKRQVFLGALDMAQAMIERASDVSLCDRPDNLIAQRPYFKRQIGFEPVEISEVEIEGTLEYSETAYLCQRLATLTVVFDEAPPDCQTLEKIEVVWPPCECPRFAPDWCNVAYDEATLTLTAQTFAWALVSPDAETINEYGQVAFPKIDDDDIYLDELTVRLTFTQPRDKAISVWSDPCCLNSTPPVDPCESECCPDIEKEHCFKADGYLWVLEDSSDCRCTCFRMPRYYRLDGLRRGLWRSEMAEAVVSLMNNLLPQSYCGCNEVSAMRYKRDTLIGERDISGNYHNPFGILTPGALLAWRIMSNILDDQAIVGSL